MSKEENAILRDQLVKLLRGGRAHADFDAATSNIPAKYYGAAIKELPYTLWQVLEHMRRAQNDILDYIKNPHYKERQFPDDYWPKEKSPAKHSDWDHSLEAFQKDLEEITKIVENPKSNLYEQLPYVKANHNLLREVLILSDHNAYHTGQLILMRRLLGIWKE